jgi:hypothetical protein
MTAALSSASRALLVVVVVVLLADALLGMLTGAVSAIGGSPAAPWWIEGRLVERSRWLVFAVLLGVLPNAAAVWRLVGALALAVPLLWIVSLWIVQALVFTVAGRWDIDGQVFLSADYYRRLFAGYAPWALGGAAALVWSRHVA